MKTVKVLNTIASVFGILWIASVFALVILMILKSEHLLTQPIAQQLSNVVLIPFGTFWVIAFGIASVASDKEITLIRKY